MWSRNVNLRLMEATVECVWWLGGMVVGFALLLFFLWTLFRDLMRLLAARLTFPKQNCTMGFPWNNLNFQSFPSSESSNSGTNSYEMLNQQAKTHSFEVLNPLIFSCRITLNKLRLKLCQAQV